MHRKQHSLTLTSAVACSQVSYWQQALSREERLGCSGDNEGTQNCCDTLHKAQQSGMITCDLRAAVTCPRQREAKECDMRQVLQQHAEGIETASATKQRAKRPSVTTSAIPSLWTVQSQRSKLIDCGECPTIENGHSGRPDGTLMTMPDPARSLVRQVLVMASSRWRGQPIWRRVHRTLFVPSDGLSLLLGHCLCWRSCAGVCAEADGGLQWCPTCPR